MVDRKAKRTPNATKSVHFQYAKLLEIKASKVLEQLFSCNVTTVNATFGEESTKLTIPTAKHKGGSLMFCNM